AGKDLRGGGVGDAFGHEADLVRDVVADGEDDLVETRMERDAKDGRGRAAALAVDHREGIEADRIEESIVGRRRGDGHRGDDVGTARAGRYAIDGEGGVAQVERRDATATGGKRRGG